MSSQLGEQQALKMLNMEKKDDFFCLLFPAMALFLSCMLTEDCTLFAVHAMKSWIYRHRSHRMLTPPRFLTAPLKWMVEIDWNDLVQLGYHGGKTWTRHKCYCPLLLYLTTPVSFGASSPNLLMVPFTLLPLKTRLLNSPDYDDSFHCFISMWWVWCAPKNFIWW